MEFYQNYSYLSTENLINTAVVDKCICHLDYNASAFFSLNINKCHLHENEALFRRAFLSDSWALSCHVLIPMKFLE